MNTYLNYMTGEKINIEELCNFLVKAKKLTYASGEESKKIQEIDKSTTLIYKDGDWNYCDNYFGGEPFGGREVVSFQNKPLYTMVYYGVVEESVIDFNEVYRVLQGALLQIPKKAPFRGPEEFEQDGFRYINDYTGDVRDFFGTEKIFSRNGKEIYRAKYIGGLVDQRK